MISKMAQMNGHI